MYRVFRYVEINLVDRFLTHAMVPKLNMTYEFSCFNNNNSANIKDMKNVYKTNFTGLITPHTKFQSPQMKDKKTSIFSEFVYDRRTQFLVPNILSTPIATVLKH